MHRQTEGRHFTDYFARMGSSLAVSCFGGWFLLPVPQQEAGWLCMLGRRLMKALQRPTVLVAQWDSWRMWEGFASGAAVLQLDFDRHGFRLGGPHPEAMRHYVSVDPSNLNEAVEVLRDVHRLRSIGEAGRLWALEHYRSLPIAARILQDLGLLKQL